MQLKWCSLGRHHIVLTTNVWWKGTDEDSVPSISKQEWVTIVSRRSTVRINDGRVVICTREAFSTFLQIYGEKLSVRREERRCRVVPSTAQLPRYS